MKLNSSEIEHPISVCKPIDKWKRKFFVQNLITNSLIQLKTTISPCPLIHPCMYPKSVLTLLLKLRTNTHNFVIARFPFRSHSMERLPVYRFSGSWYQCYIPTMIWPYSETDTNYFTNRSIIKHSPQMRSFLYQKLKKERMKYTEIKQSNDLLVKIQSELRGWHLYQAWTKQL